MPSPGGSPLRPAYLSDVSGLTFTQATGIGDIGIGSYSQPSGAPASAFLPNAADYGGDIWLGLNYTVPAPLGSHQHYVLLHEMGHAVGLEHGNVYNPTSPTNPPNLSPQFDSMKYSIMSYNMDPNAANTYPSGLQQFDIAALQEMYGVNYSTRNDDTTYSFSTSPGILTIWDGGGIDKIDAQAFTQRVVIDLQPGHFSSIGGTENVAMSLVSHLSSGDQSKPLIENAQGGSGNDDLIGNSAKNILNGGAGLNLLKGLGGDDILVSEGLYDILDGGIGNDALINSQRDGNTQYVFGRGYGHDGIIDEFRFTSGITVYLSGLAPRDIQISCTRYDRNLELPPDQRPPVPNYAYGAPTIKILDTGDTLILPWVFRPDYMFTSPWFMPMFSYAGDAIQFEGGATWDIENLESYVSYFRDVGSEAEFNAVDPITYAWLTPDVAPWY